MQVTLTHTGVATPSSFDTGLFDPTAMQTPLEQQPHGTGAVTTVSGCLMKVMDTAGIDVTVFKGHSTTLAATSKAKSKGLSVAEIMSKAN